MSSSSSFSLPSSSSSIEKENGHPPPTSMLFRFQQLEERIIATTTCTHTQLPVVPSIMDIIGCDITIDDIQLAKQELINQGVDLNMDVNETQTLTLPWNDDITWWITPLIHFCLTGNLLIIKLLFLIGADCTKLCKDNDWFPMFVAAAEGHLDICKWLFEYGGDAKYQINKETSDGRPTPLRQAYIAWVDGRDKEGKSCCWLLLNGGGQHLSSEAMGCLRIKGTEETNSNLLVLWMRENMQLRGTFLLILCGATTMNTSSLSSSEPNDGGTRKHTRKRKIHPERSLQILDGHPGIMELIGDYVGLLRGKEFRMLKEFNESVIEYNRDESNRDESDDDDY